MQSESILAFDIGGANIKAVAMKIENKKAILAATHIEHFPIWRMGKERLQSVLKKVENIVSVGPPHHLAVTMTAELSDIFFTKREGVNYILACVEALFPHLKLNILDVNGELVDSSEARKGTLKIASSNWMGTAWMASMILKDCILVDIGSTTTDIIPIMNGKVVSKGRTDLERLSTGELIYTGALRTNAAVILNEVLIQRKRTRVSSELFATSGDANLILGKIKEDDYITETADGRGVSRIEASARLARVVCADIEMLGEDVIVLVAEQIYRKQLAMIAETLRQVHKCIGPNPKKEFPIIVSGVGKFLARDAAKKAGFNNIIDLGDIIGREASKVASCVGLAFLTASSLGAEISW